MGRGSMTGIRALVDQSTPIQRKHSSYTRKSTPYSSRTQLPPATPLQLMPATALLAILLSRRADFQFEPSTEIGSVASGSHLAARSHPLLNPLGLPLPMFMAGVGRTSLPLVDWRADVKMDVGRTDPSHRVLLMSVGDDDDESIPSSMKKSRDESSRSDAGEAEFIYELVPPAAILSTICRRLGGKISLSFPSGGVEKGCKALGVNVLPTGLGVPIGVVSAVEERPASLASGE